MTSRWSSTPAPRGDDYDARWTALAAQGKPVHGEADCVEKYLQQFGLRPRVVDAGCGTGRVAIELAARGFEVIGVDLDPSMLATARAKAPSVAWFEADLAEWCLPPEGEPFDGVVLAGNVMIFVAPGTEATVLENLAHAIVPGGVVIAGFQVRADRLPLDEYDAAATRAGLELVARHATWDGDEYTGGDYAVSVHRTKRSVEAAPSR